MISRSELNGLDLSEWSEGELLTLMRKICDHLEQRTADEFTADDIQEYERRLREADEHPEILITLDELKARMGRAP